MWPVSQRRYCPVTDFYSHIPCGMWQTAVWMKIDNEEISTHTSRVGCDGCEQVLRSTQLNFYSHIPCGMWRPALLQLLEDCKISTHTSRVGCDRFRCGRDQLNFISTHTSRVGCDHFLCGSGRLLCNFYSHIPCGMWPLYIVYFNHIIPIYYRMDL